jgi:hypothetical protein
VSSIIARCVNKLELAQGDAAAAEQLVAEYRGECEYALLRGQLCDSKDPAERGRCNCVACPPDSPCKPLTDPGSTDISVTGYLLTSPAVRTGGMQYTRLLYETVCEFLS